MIGIYKITNKLNGKIYIGQSNNIKRRFQEHCYKGAKSRIPIDAAIEKYGKENFSFDIIVECSLDELDNLETYWIEYYDAVQFGYNCNYGGSSSAKGEYNGRALLTENDVIAIRTAYNNHKRKRDVYELVKDKITFSSFEAVWEGRVWRHIMPEVLTKENKLFYSKQATLGELSATAVFTDEEVLEFRKRYVNETAKEIWSGLEHRCGFQTLQQILWGRTYKHLPIYAKKLKKWIEPVSTIPEA